MSPMLQLKPVASLLASTLAAKVAQDGPIVALDKALDYVAFKIAKHIVNQENENRVRN